MFCTANRKGIASSPAVDAKKLPKLQEKKRWRLIEDWAQILLSNLVELGGNLAEEGCLFCPCSSFAVRYRSRKSPKCEFWKTALSSNFLHQKYLWTETVVRSRRKMITKIALWIQCFFTFLSRQIALRQLHFLWLALLIFNAYRACTAVKVGG